VNPIARWALALYGVTTLVVGGLVAIVIEFQVPNPEELLRDVADRRPMWMAANALLIVQQVLLTVAAPALARTVRSRSVVAADAVLGLLMVAAGAFIASGTFHGVLGAHLAPEVTTGPLDPDLVRSAEVLHALGDTTWFIGLGAVTATTAVCAVVWWRADDRGLRWRARLGVAAVIVGCLQYGWFVAHVLGLFAVPGALLQALWFVAVAASTTGQPPAPVVEAPTT
jgi:hypothetical protein